MVDSTPRLLCPRERDPVPIVREAGWASGPVCKIHIRSSNCFINRRGLISFAVYGLTCLHFLVVVHYLVNIQLFVKLLTSGQLN
jgi:hypothetical protein